MQKLTFLRSSGLIFITLFLFTSIGLPQVSRELTLFGPEPTFQDQGMVDEPGRMTFITPHKKRKFNEMINHFLALLGNPAGVRRETINHDHFKPGVRLTIPDVGEFVIDMEPVCVEWNQNPVTVNQIEQAWAPVFLAARASGLEGHVQPAGERSGMGHIHVGGRVLGENPYFKHPTLLRNMMVLLHQNPALLWGFSEAYDLGPNSNIETHHLARQERFVKAIAEFDRWYNSAGDQEKKYGAFVLLQKLYENEPPSNEGFFRHYRYMNLEHLQKLGFNLSSSQMDTLLQKSGKFTVEHRHFRPFQSEKHMRSLAELLLEVMDKMANDKYLEPLKPVTAEEYARFHSVSSVDRNWEIIKNRFDLTNDPTREEMIRDYTQNLLEKRRLIEVPFSLAIIPAYSPKEHKGHFYEVLIPTENYERSSLPSKVKAKEAEFNLKWEEVVFRGKKYFQAFLQTQTSSNTLEPFELLNENLRLEFDRNSAQGSLSCESLLRTAL